MSRKNEYILQELDQNMSKGIEKLMKPTTVDTTDRHIHVMLVLLVLFKIVAKIIWW